MDPLALENLFSILRIKQLENKVASVKNYQITATLEITRNEEIFSYDVVSTYQKNDYFKVQLTNKQNNHEQIILKNDEGVYVVTPSLNKSFKFQSDWPYNNSQVYLLDSILNDINNDSEKTFEEKFFLTLLIESLKMELGNK